MRNLVPYRHNHMGSPLHREFFTDNFFAPFFNMSDYFGTSSFRVDIRENEDHYEISADLPGVPEDQIEITVDDGLLTIAADMNEEKKEEKDGYLYSERRSGRFQRSFNLDSSRVREEDISAHYENGVLCVNIPKQEDCQKKSRRISLS